MKKIFLFMVLIAFMSISYSQSSIVNTEQGQLVTLDIPISLAKSTSYYSDEFNLDGYLPFDSTNFFPVIWQSNDTVQVTITIEVKNSVAPLGSSYEGSWQTAVTVVSTQSNVGTDVLWVKNVFQRGTIASGVTESVTMDGKIGNTGRIKVTFANPSTVGNSGQFRIWTYLPRR